METRSTQTIDLGKFVKAYGGIDYPDPTEDPNEKLPEPLMAFIPEGQPIPVGYQKVDTLANGVKVAQRLPSVKSPVFNG